MPSRKYASVLQEEGNLPENQYGTFARPTEDCRQSLEKMAPHPSETTPRVPCHQYYPSYCKKNKKKVCILPENTKVIVNLAKNGDIQKVTSSKNGHIIRKDYEWSRIAPLQPPLSNNIPDCIPEKAWDPNCRGLYPGS